MEFNWATFFLEIINFLVLVWILKKLLYQPIKRIIVARESAIQKIIADAQQTNNAAIAMQQKYENRLQEWEKEKNALLAAAQNEIQQEKTKQMAALQAALQREHERSRAQEEHRIANLLDKKTKAVINAGAKFTSVLLKQFADADLENKIFEILLKKIPGMPNDKIGLIKKELNNHAVPIIVKSAYPLTTEQQNKIMQSLMTIFAVSKIKPEFIVAPELIAGFVLSIGSLIIQLNLREELKSFVEMQSKE